MRNVLSSLSLDTFSLKSLGKNICADHLITYPDNPQYLSIVKRYTTYVQQNKMARYENKVKHKIEFESIATSSKKVKKSTEKLNTAVLCSPTNVIPITKHNMVKIFIGCSSLGSMIFYLQFGEAEFWTQRL
ncbi:hypothetical protein ACJMK2_000336 [Sinanodonta woodiana]|uniref:Uncharacterized protein n=1 Tax=Sinanodonta woodiana TaxID=1069815 RepID=A0ABD3XQR2_SINWO